MYIVIKMMEDAEETSTELKPTHITCQVCNESLPIHLFPKKKWQTNKKQKTTVDSNNDRSSAIICCHQCRKNQTRARMNQPLKTNFKVGRRAESGITRRPNNHGYCNYLDQLFGMDCFPDIVNLKAFTSAKDVSESMAAIQAACQHGLDTSIKEGSGSNSKKKTLKIKCLCIGDGCTPRTAVLGCFLKKWDCTSIDPALHEVWHGDKPKGVRGLVGFGGTLEEYMSTTKQTDSNEETYDHLVILCVHSHARLIGNASISNIMIRYNNIPTTLIALDCCPKFKTQRDIGRAPDVCYEDDCVFSACRKVEVWNLKGFATCGECS